MTRIQQPAFTLVSATAADLQEQINVALMNSTNNVAGSTALTSTTGSRQRMKCWMHETWRRRHSSRDCRRFVFARLRVIGSTPCPLGAR